MKTIGPRIATLSSSRLKATTGGSWRDGKTTAERGYGGKWQRERERFLRDNPLCVFCQQNGHVVAATVVDHKVPHRGNMVLFWDRNNWQGLCIPCHSSEKQRQEREEFGVGGY